MRPAMQLHSQLPRSGIVVHGYLCAWQQTRIADKSPQHKEHGITEHTTGCRNVLVVVLYIVEGIVFFPVYTLPSERYLMVFLSCGVPRLCLPLLVTGNLSGMPAVLLIDCFLFCAHTCMYMSLCMVPMPASVVPRPAFAVSFARDVLHAASGCRVLARIMSWTLWSAATAFTEPVNFHRQLPWSSHHIQHEFEQPRGYPHTCPFSRLT